MSIPKILSISKLSEITGIDRRTISKRLEELEPVEETSRSKMYNVQEALPFIYTSGGLREAEQLRYETARADKMELEVAKRRGELVEIDKVVKVYEQRLIAVRAGIIALPNKQAAVLASITDPNIMKTELEIATNEVLEELQIGARNKLKELGVTEGGTELIDSPSTERRQSSETETETDPSTMG